MKLAKIVAIVIVITGVIILGIGLKQLWDIKNQGEKSLESAKEVVGDLDQSKNPDDLYKPDNGNASGLLVIPKIDAELAIVEGTDPDDLEKGVGHYRGSYYPEENGQIVLSGHRDTVFRNVGKLAIGDALILQMPYGEYTYKITGTKIVKANDKSIITLQNEKEELILTTCYPFNYIGNAPNRYIMYAERTDKK